MEFYIAYSLAIVVCLLAWWLFLAISGMNLHSAR